MTDRKIGLKRLEIREETDETAKGVLPSHRCPFGLYEEGWRYSWHNTRAEALEAAHELLEGACARRKKLEEELDEVRDEVHEYNLAVLALDADPANK
ncbi:hypothetical protein LCGC14_3104720 [marine sediment metagenome]|uniref:Uncharacterized protein n=1 Tax=marine sediment metagenome TaxID=412755 RepID=A0A0F8W6T9_9ZZZZ